MNEHRRIQSLLGPYLLGSLEPEEMLEVREHLNRCGECRAEEMSLRRSHEYLTDLASVTETPPPDLKDRIMSGLPRREPRRTPLYLAAAAICLLAVLGLLFATDVFTRDTVSTTLQPTEFAPQAGGELRVQRDAPNVEATLEVWDLPRPEPNEYYELWFGKGEGRVSAGTFTVDAEGRGTLSMTVPQTTGEYERVGITLEEFPEEPSMDSPTVVLGGELDES
ncbi:MAG: anti-sigma factor domain-containing protein [Rubrobacteraceae bacterium]